MKVIIGLSALVAFLALNTVSCEISLESESSLELDKMPEKKWAEYKVSNY